MVQGGSQSGAAAFARGLCPAGRGVFALPTAEVVVAGGSTATGGGVIVDGGSGGGAAGAAVATSIGGSGRGSTFSVCAAAGCPPRTAIAARHAPRLAAATETAATVRAA